MRNLFRLIIISTVFTLFQFAQPSQAYGFEGVFNMNIKHSDDKTPKSLHDLTFYLKDTRGKLEMKNEQGVVAASVIWNTAKDEIMILTDQDGQKMALKASFSMWNMMQDQLVSMADYDMPGDEEDFKWRKTNERKIIDGVNCVKHIGESDEYKMEAWVTSEMRFPQEALAPFINSMPALANFQGLDDGFMKQARVIGKKDNTVLDINNSVKREEVAEDKLSTPRGYMVMDIGRMLQQMSEMDEETSKRFFEQMFQGR
ncbi:MAG: DUF4412 domain-containing protein [Chitinophagaceae bacterium]|nr:MAG: DUF4412 domain-containing protein [Chitinophagaceae bacterium]